MKLYVWVSPYRVPYGSSLVFAIAESEEAAKEQCQRGLVYKYGEYQRAGNPGVPLGKPTRIVDIPCAEWHEWSE